jgi:class 3 adenylate cyclase
MRTIEFYVILKFSMADSEKQPSEEQKDSSAFTEEYSETLTHFLHSLIHQNHFTTNQRNTFTTNQNFKDILYGSEYSEIRQRAIEVYLDSYQTSCATFRLRAEISALEKKAHKQADEITKHTADKKRTIQEIDKLRGIIDELNNKQGLQHLLNSVSSDVHEKIETDEKFRLQFTSDAEVNAFVVSIDIRRSTELMLKARSPKLFADFITTLCGDLEDIFKQNWAVIDKFTGDGILAFFPEFFSGPDAGFLALLAAKQANDAFSRRYRQFRTSFTTILNDVGLGTGIDYGKVHQVRMAGALTIVGQPVVYACRMGGAPAGKILMNQPAFEVISNRYENLTIIDETLISIKAEGDLVAYDVRLLNRDFIPESPSWIPSMSKE